MERQLIRDYEALMEEVLAGLGPDTHATAVELAALPDRIRGFGPIKERFLAHARKREAELLTALLDRTRPPAAVSGGPPASRPEAAVIAG
jgi:indolepyruvate ferredoxin oxidoreductase